MSLQQLFSSVKLLICDVDGVLTRGDIAFLDTGDEMKTFHTQDGLGMRLLLDESIWIAGITKRRCNGVSLRFEQLGIKHLYQGVQDKLPVFEKLLDELELPASAVAYMGDDWPDLPVLNRVGLPIAVANAVPEVKAKAKYITTMEGGKGAVREVAMCILQAKGLMAKVLGQYDY